MTDFPITVIRKRMGRKPLSDDSGTIFTGVRMTEEVKNRIVALVGKTGMAKFIREAIERELERREAEQDNK